MKKHNTRKISQKTFEKRSYKHNSKIKILGIYKGEYTHPLVNCLVCHRDWHPLAKDLMRGHCHCPYCTHHAPLSESTFMKRAAKASPNIKILGRYIARNKRITIQCKKCGWIWHPYAASVLKGDGCPKCAHVRGKITHTEFVKQIQKTEPNLKILSKYKNAKSNVLVYCKICHKTFTRPARYLLIGRGCPRCNSHHSKGEQAVIAYLLKHHYKFQTQYMLPGCKYKKELPFDDAVFNKDKTLNCVIEYQGWQHFLKPNDNKNHKFYTNHKLKNMLTRDKIKKQYCKKHHIQLIYINHPQYNNYKYDSYKYIQKLVAKTLNAKLHMH